MVVSRLSLSRAGQFLRKSKRDNMSREQKGARNRSPANPRNLSNSRWFVHADTRTDHKDGS